MPIDFPAHVMWIFTAITGAIEFWFCEIRIKKYTEFLYHVQVLGNNYPSLFYRWYHHVLPLFASYARGSGSKSVEKYRNVRANESNATDNCSANEVIFCVALNAFFAIPQNIF
jgi:hypothetical protein